MDPRIKLIINKAVDMEPNEKLTAALDSLYVKMTVVPIQRAFHTKDFLEHNNLKHCCCCYRHYSSSSEDDE